MTNRVCIIPIGDASYAQDVLTALTPDGSPFHIKNKYFEATISFDFDTGGRPPAVIWICHSRFCDLTPPPTGLYQDAELRLLLRVVDETSQEEMPEKLKDWEVDNYAEILNVNMSTLEDEFRHFKEDGHRTGLLDEPLAPAGCRLLESLEMVNWPIKVSAGKPLMQQKIE